MGYDLTIGQLKMRIVYEGLDSWVCNEAEDVRLGGAPAYGEPTDYTNSRWPSYTSWCNSMRFVGLFDFMFNVNTGLLRDHPGCVPLTAEHKDIIDNAHKDIIDNAHKAFYEKYPNAKAGYSPKINEEEGILDDPDWPIENSMATRLEWLKYWVDWALSNCSTPVFHNS